MIRRRRPARLLPFLFALLFALLLALPFYWRLDAEEFHGDESHWISSGQQALALLSAGGWHDPQWREEFYFFSQPQVGKVLIGLALRGAGIWGPSAVYDYDWQLRPSENRAAGRVPAPAAITAGRIVGATAGWVACLALWGLGGALQRDQGGTRRAPHVGTTRWFHLGGGGVASRAGAAGALLLASHPLWLANARRAGLDAPALALGLLAALLAVWALRRRAPSAPLLPLLLAGALAGLAVGTKYVALLALPAALVPFAAALRGASGRARGALLVGAPLSLLVAGMVFWATNPALYPDPPGGLRVSLDFLTTQAAGMRWRSPVFQYPALVAVEVIDRAVWPLGFPAVVDQTLPEPLRPGSYGTPAVALGALAGLLALARPATAPLGPTLAPLRPPGRASRTSPPRSGREWSTWPSSAACPSGGSAGTCPWCCPSACWRGWAWPGSAGATRPSSSSPPPRSSSRPSPWAPPTWGRGSAPSWGRPSGRACRYWR